MTKNSIVQMVRKAYEYSDIYSVGIVFFVENNTPRWQNAREYHKKHKEDDSLYFINELDFPSMTAVYTIANALWRKSHSAALTPNELREAYTILLIYLTKYENGMLYQDIRTEVNVCMNGSISESEKSIYLRVFEMVREYLDPMKIKSKIVNIMQYDI